jgi:hypothetical protein
VKSLCQYDREDYEREPARDVLTGIYSAMVILRTSRTEIGLKRIGSNPLGPLFGTNVIRYRNTDVIRKFMAALSSDSMSAQFVTIMDLVSVSERRTVVWVNCKPFELATPSVIEGKPSDNCRAMHNLMSPEN